MREWCINSAAVDPVTKSILANSEDGKLYRWNLTTNTLAPAIALSPGIGEAYTPTVIGPDGTVYAINWAILNAVGTQSTVSPTPAPTPTCIPGANNSISGQVRYYSNGLPLSGATVLLSGATTASAQTDAAGQFAFTGSAGATFTSSCRSLVTGTVASVRWMPRTRCKRSPACVPSMPRSGWRATSRETARSAPSMPRSSCSNESAWSASFPVAQACASDWLFVPMPAAAANQHLVQPQNMAVVNTCQPGAIEFAPLAGKVTNQDFAAVLIGDCTGNWQPATPTPSP